MMKGARLVGVYGKPWSRMAQDGIPLSRRVLERLGQAIVDAIVGEAKKDLAKERSRAKGSPEGVPNSQKFFDSFGYQIVGTSTVAVTCSWPYIQQIVEGRDKAPMRKLTLARGGEVVPIRTSPSTVIFRVVPPKLSGAWVHPGFARHTFIRRGVAKGRETMAMIIQQEVQAHLMAGDPFR